MTEQMMMMPPLTWEAAQQAVVPPTQELVGGLVEAGTAGLLTGLPYTYKSWLALEIAYKVAAGGRVLGRFPVLQQGPVGYCWYDDGYPQQLRRIQAYGQTRGGALPVYLWLATAEPRLRLPTDLPKLAAAVQRYGLVLIVLDSLYNFTPGTDFRDQAAGALLAQLKAEVCDATGCAALILHHAAWKGGQGRAYGDVFQEAAVRWGIHLQREGKGVILSTRANNMAPTAKLALRWDDAVVGLVPADASELDGAVLGFLTAHYDASTRDIEQGVGGNRQRVRDALQRLVEAGRLHKWSPDPPGRARATQRYHAADACSSAACTVAPVGGATTGEPAARAAVTPDGRAGRPAPIGAGNGRPDDGAAVNGTGDDSLAATAARAAREGAYCQSPQRHAYALGAPCPVCGRWAMYDPAAKVAAI